MKSLKSKIITSLLVILGCSVIGTGIFVAVLLKSSYLDTLTDRLEREGKMIAETIKWEELNDQSAIQEKAILFGIMLDAYVHIYDQNGKLLGDSHPTVEMDEKLIPPEVRFVLQNQKVNPPVIHENWLHLTLPIEKEGQLIGAIRITIDIEDINQSVRRVWILLAIGLVFAFIVAAIFSSQIASRVTRPLEEIMRVAVDIAQKKFYRRVRNLGKDDEVSRLGKAINLMAQSLQNQVERIRKSERRLNSIIETMESGVIMVDSTGKVSLANRAFERMFGIPASDIVNHSYKKLTYPYDLSPLITDCAEKCVRMRREIHLYFPEERTLDVHLAPMWVEQNGVGVVVVFHDITAMRRLEQLRKDFVANVSHELKTPITSIRGFSETLLDGALKDEETCRDFLNIIYQESLRLERLIGELLDLSRIESKQFLLRVERTSISSLIDSVIKTILDQAKQKQLSLVVEIPDNFEVEVDPDRMRQILLNLLTNAITNTPKGGEISVKAIKENIQWSLSVSDTGIGIPENDLPRIFERFYRVDKARSRDSGGTGLGLAIVKHLVEAHHGKIQVKSHVGKGTTFTLTFPVKTGN